MKKRTIKIFSLNIHNYHDFDRRCARIARLIKKYNPDIVALQEVRDDRAINQSGMNQAKQINRMLGFRHVAFLPTMNMTRVKGIKGRPACYEGLALLSKFPFSSKGISLRKHRNDKYSRKILAANVSVQDREMPVFVVHFSPNDLFARLHAEETFAHARLLRPLIVGDFNIRFSEEVKDLSGKNGYVSSARFKYTSYPADKCSYDYILIPEEHSFLRFKCIPDKVSDHRAIVAIIKL